MAKTKVLAGRVDNEVYDRLLEICSNNGSLPGDVVKEAVGSYINNHAKLDHPDKTVVKPEFKTLKLEMAEPSSDIDPDDFVEEMWDSFVAYARDQGYSLVKTDHLQQLLDVIELRKGDRLAKEPPVSPASATVTCPGCGDTTESDLEDIRNAKRDDMEFVCDKCGRRFEIDLDAMEKNATKKSSPKKETKSHFDLTEAE